MFLPDLGRQDHRFDELVVLEAVADDRRVVVIDDRHHREQFRLAAGFEAEAIFLAEAVNLLDDVPLLVHLDRIDAAILAFVLVLGDGVGESLVNLADAMLEDVGEANQAGKLDVALAKLIDEFFQIDRRLGEVAVRMDGDMALVVDGEIAVAPVADAIELGGILGRPDAWDAG